MDHEKIRKQIFEYQVAIIEYQFNGVEAGF